MTEILSILRQDKRSVIPATSDTGQRGELLAARFLESIGYRLVLSNFKVSIGRNSRGAAVTGEIDIIALEGQTLCFIEVKTRVSAEFAPPTAAITTRKQRQITRAARVYRRIFGLTDMPYRYDVVSVLLPRNAEPQINVTRDFWTESQFRKRKWTGDIY